MSARKKELLLDHLRNTDADVRSEAADRVREQVSSSTREAVIDQLADDLVGKYYDKRWQAARALGLIGSARSDVLDALASRLDDKHAHVRRCAAEAIGRIGARHGDLAERDDVTDALSACLVDDDSEAVCQAAEQARQTLLNRAASEPPPCSSGSGGGGRQDAIREGKVYEGEVKAVKDYGALVEIVPDRVGLLHISEMDYGYIEDVTDYFQAGDRVRVKLLEAEEERLRLTRKPFVGPNPWDEVDDRFRVGDTAVGEVVSIRRFGAFVDLGRGITGLVHISEMKEEFVDHPGDVVSVGQQVETEVLEVSADDRKMSLRLKQTDPKGRAGGERSFKSTRRCNGKSFDDEEPAREVLLVDGSNVCRSWATLNGDRTASLDVLLTLLVELVGQGFDFECIFDATIPHVLRKRARSGAEDAFRHLKNELPSRISRVPGGTDADDLLLQKADRRGLRIVTNDRFRDKRETYPWVAKRESERLIKGCVNGSDLQVVSLDLFAEAGSDTQDMVDQLVRTVLQHNKDTSQDGGSRSRGELKWFDPEKGFGFVERSGAGEDVFLHGSNLSGTTTGDELRERQEIAFEVKHTPKGPQAVDASPLE